jgi:aromatic amino acid aminotransferase I / 2-aminoadipate transaminase
MTPPAMDFDVAGVTDTSSILIPNPVLAHGPTHAVFSVDDIAPHRAKSAPMPQGVAAFTSSDMFKSPSCFKKPRAKRWDHRINLESSSRQGSSLKGAAKHLKKPGLISLGGGLPSSDYFPFEHISIKVPVPPQFSEAETVESGDIRTAGKYDIREGKSLYDLSVSLNYGQATGAAQLVRFVTEHTEVVHNPPYSDWACSLTAGSTSALEMAFRMFCTRGDYMLTEEYTFATAVETAHPLGIHVVGIRADAEGILATDLDHVLSTWDMSIRKGPKPFFLYTVPTGQNPTGATQSLERRKAIYAVAEKHDLYIIEDEPYYFLQMERYRAPSVQNGTLNDHSRSKFEPTTASNFLSALIPSYLSFDISGRVLRLDSFSKIIAPGTRTGWVTGTAQVIERFVRHHEVSTQNPSGISQIVLYKLLEEAWGHKGFLEWLMFIRAEYTARRDIIVNACERELPPEVCSWTPPQAGMFFWIKVNWRKHPDFNAGDGSANAFFAIEEHIFLAAVEKGVLCSKGSWFRAQRGTDTEMFFRTTFAAASSGDIVEAMRRFGEALREEFGLLDAHANGISHSNNGQQEMNGHCSDIGRCITTQSSIDVEEHLQEI